MGGVGGLAGLPEELEFPHLAQVHALSSLSSPCACMVRIDGAFFKVAKIRGPSKFVLRWQTTNAEIPLLNPKSFKISVMVVGKESGKLLANINEISERTVPNQT